MDFHSIFKFFKFRCEWWAGFFVQEWINEQRIKVSLFLLGVCVCLCVYGGVWESANRRISVWSDGQTVGAGISFLFLFINPLLPPSCKRQFFFYISTVHIRPTCHVLFIAMETSLFQANFKKVFGSVSKGRWWLGNSASPKTRNEDGIQQSELNTAACLLTHTQTHTPPPWSHPKDMPPNLLSLYYSDTRGRK